jgi:DNA-binding NtrC family response regulator
MLQTVLERVPTIDQINDLWAPRQKEISASIAKNILIVEDDTGIREILEEILQEETIHQIFLAQDGESCLKMLQTATPSLFLLDYRLPDINGLELLDHIRRIKGYEQTPVVLMSASLSRENITRDHLRYLRKPFDLDKLLQMVEEGLTENDAESPRH